MLHAIAAAGLATIFAESPATRNQDTVSTNVTSTVLIQLEPWPPQVQMDPAGGSETVSMGTNITLRFSEPVQAQTLASGITVTAGGQPVSGTLLARVGGIQAPFDPDQSLPPDATINVVVTGAVALRELPAEEEHST